MRVDRHLKIKVIVVGVGQHKNERIIIVPTNNGVVETIVHVRSLEGDLIDVYMPLNENDDEFLVELPHETVSGSWRVWVPKMYCETGIES